MSKAVITREEIKQDLEQDEVLMTWLKFSHWFAANRVPILAVLVVILAAVVGWKVKQYREEQIAAGANLLFGKAQKSFNEAMFAGKAGSEERTKALQAAIKSTTELAATYPTAATARLGKYLEASAYLAMGDKDGSAENTEKALAGFKAYAAAATNGEEKASGLLGVGAALANRSWLKPEGAEADQQEALKAYADAATAAGEAKHLVFEAKLAQGRLHAARGENEKAIALFKEVVKARPLMAVPKVKADAENSETATDAARQQARTTVYSVLNQFSFAREAETELQALIPKAELEELMKSAKPEETPAAKKK